jgi:hypothetical protein
MSTLILVLFACSIIIYLTFDGVERLNISFRQPPTSAYANFTLIDFLTQYKKRVVKDYSKKPKNSTTSHYNITGKIIQNEHVEIVYNFPLINRMVSKFSCRLNPAHVSRLVDTFGVSSPSFENQEDSISIAIPPAGSPDFHTFKSELEAGSLEISDEGSVTVNYLKVIENHKSLGQAIANHILDELKANSFDNYFNRIQAALNFVQHIPYGIPDFDARQFIYLGLALPAEAFVLNYADCDSKSVLFATIICNLIDADNIVLVKCTVANSNAAPENHMMVAVKGLNITYGQHIQYEQDSYLLMETTLPAVIGEWSWERFELEKVIKL